jgi:hypothetical protein
MGRETSLCCFFKLSFARFGFHKKHIGTHYAELVFLHLVGYVGHVVNSSPSEAQNIDALFSCLGEPVVVSIKSTTGHVTPNLHFCIWLDQQGT